MVSRRNTAELTITWSHPGVYYDGRAFWMRKKYLKLKNKFVKLYVIRINDLPNYQSGFNSRTFFLFFGLWGDTAYGLLIFIASLILRKKAKLMKPVFSLAAWLGVYHRAGVTVFFRF